MKPNEAMRALPIEDEAAYGQSYKRMCQLINIRCTSIHAQVLKFNRIPHGDESEVLEIRHNKKSGADHL